MSPKKKIIIAHRGASAYLPEHTLEAKAMAYAQGADYLEQDVVMTRDGHAVVVHDHFLETVSDAEIKFPGRSRSDGRYYVIDFSLDEIKNLRLHERTNLHTNAPVYPKRFPLKASSLNFTIPTLEEEIEFIQGLNASTGKDIGIYTEIKTPWFHEREGIDIASRVLNILREFGYDSPDSNCYIQCFDPACLKRLKFELKTGIKLIQLIADNSWFETPEVDYNTLITDQGLDDVKNYACGIGPWMQQLVADDGSGRGTKTGLAELSRKKGLLLHPFTFRADDLPSYAKDYDSLLDLFFGELDVDGIFTDFPDLGAEYLKGSHKNFKTC